MNRLINLNSIINQHAEPVGSPEAGEELLDALGWEWDLDGDHADRGSYFHPEHPYLRATIGYGRLLGYHVNIWREES